MKNSYSSWAARWRVGLGFVFAAAYLIVSRPTVPLLVTGGAVALAGLALRAVAAGYIDKNQALATAGPFAYTRNPLYLGSLILGVGFMIAGESWILAVVFIALFALIYLPVMRREEEFLHRKFGTEFAAYAQAVPLIFPIPSRRWHGAGHFRWARYGANREYNAAIGYTATVAVLAIKIALRSHGTPVSL
jgi:protein-S-isoprenylcysteine O-methyltransferase Ste14